MEKKIILSPSLMCGDLANLEGSIQELESIGMDSLHIDVIDGSFSPSMPLGIETIKRIREITSMNFDVHIMAKDNEFFIGEMLKIGVESITFHYETSLHIDRYIQLIKNSGTKVGIALNPATPLNVLQYILPEIDRICLMLINPGFATNKSEKQISYALKKITDLCQLVNEKELAVDIQVDGRVSLEMIPGLLDAGATNLVLGSTSLFLKGNTLAENQKLLYQAMKQSVRKNQ
ncbi:TPA: ribulose-phosphate 3-epimerase [Enterococcus faecium]|nr:ribulose-phosphate 3-epimerase [Enterococcus faecium]EME7161965.1 ribulose-phosphate 3-epimerase [Enterococcus faecium]EME8213662.1 ribulose-phosphate 3-epimerase [Enterococcus faecium]MCZ1504247.1 ribulose-phosphate 3-epimerase [Enterococcus faecium]MDQ8333885.1 ribulose-phosphate 3-epimerase [Enterococcus faecium]